MPRVPRLEGPTIRTEALPRVQTSPEAEQLPIAPVLEGVSKIVAEEAKKAQEAQLNDALVQARRARDNVLYNPQGGVLTRRMGDAIGAPEAFDKAYTPEMSRIAASIRDPQVRRAFEARMMQERAEAESIVLRHVDSQVRELDVQATTERVQQLADDVVGGDVTKEAEWEQTLRGGLERQGIRGELADDRVARARSALRLQQVQAAVAAGTPESLEAARRLIEAGGLRGRELTAAQQAVKGGDLTVQSQQASDALLDQYPDLEDEDAAIAAAEAQYTGDLRDRVVTRLEQHFGRARRAKQAALNAVSERVMDAAYAQREPSAEDRVWLETNGGNKVLQTAREVRRQLAAGPDVETNMAVYEEVAQLLLPQNRDKFLQTNLMEYADRLSRTDLRGFINAQIELGGGSRRPGTGLSSSSVAVETFQVAQVAGMFDERVQRMGDIEGSPEDKAIYQTLRTAVEAALTAERASGEPTPTRVRQIIRETVDRFVIDRVDQGWLSRERRTAVPRESASRDAQIRANLRAQGYIVTNQKIAAIRALDDRTDMTPEQKRAAAERIAKEP